MNTAAHAIDPVTTAAPSGGFGLFADAVRTRFKALADEPLFIVAADRDAIWQTYLDAFPAGSNPVFRTRTEHDCACCRHFIRDIGNVVAIQNGALASVWDLNGLPAHYQAVADAMAAHVKSLPIRDVFLTPVAKHGQPISHELVDGSAFEWHHFSAEAPKRFVTADHVARCGETRSTFAVLQRGVAELSPIALEQVLDLITENAIYRGEEFHRAVTAFRELQQRALAVDPKERDVLLWSMIQNPVARFRNTVIGTLVQDLTDGMDLEAAVRTYEVKVAPSNYKRPTALITKGMVQAAMKTIEELGLEGALERRHARLSDVSVDSVLFVDNAVRGQMKGGIEALLMDEVKPAPFDPKRAQPIGVDDFLRTVLPHCTGVQIYLDNDLLGHFVSMTAPAREDSGSLFRWGNDFAWSYDGNVTDSIKAKVKRAGGQVENVAMRVSLAWSNTDDLDLHVTEPDRGHIYYGAKHGRTGGVLDVDMNVSNLVRDPVENVRWVRPPLVGTYHVFVHNFTRRESIDVGFTVDIEAGDGQHTLSFEKALPARAEQPVATITVERGGRVTVAPAAGMTSGSSSQEKWGLKTLDLTRVNAVVASPNHWGDNAVGNRHLFFILDGCRNPLPTRGIYNEFLHPKLEKHRKVFEVLGDKTKCPPADEQLSGVGFSSTRKDKVTVVAMGPGLNAAYAIVF